MKINISKEQLVGLGKAGLKVGKAIIIEGTKAVAVKSVTAVIMEGFDNGSEGIKNLSVDKLVSGGKVKEDKPKKEGGLFKRRKKKEEEIDGPTDIIRDKEGDIVAIIKSDIVDGVMEGIEED